MTEFEPQDVAFFLNTSPLSILWVGENDVVVFANPAAHSLLAFSSDLSLTAAEILPEWPLHDGRSRTLVRSLDGTHVVAEAWVTRWTNNQRDIVGVTLSPLALAETADRLAEIETEKVQNLKVIREANLRLRYVIEMLPQATCVFDAEDRYLLWNRKYAELYPEIASSLREGIRFEDILRISLESGEMREIVEDGEDWLSGRLEKHRMPESQTIQRLKDGRWLRHDDRRTPDGGAIGMRVDITEFKQREEWLRQLFDANPMPMMLCDANTLALLEVNVAATAFYGHDRSTFLTMSACDMHGDIEGATDFAGLLRGLNGDCEARTVWLQKTASGQEKHVLIYVRILNEGGQRRLLLTVADVSERVHAERQANHLAHHDGLTGLANRMLFLKALQDALAKSARSGIDLAVHYLDLDSFKPVNDTFGHRVGDEVLAMVGTRLLEAVGPDNLVARLGGDEFAILQLSQTDRPQDLAERCIAALNAPFHLRGIPIAIGVSVGIAIGHRDGADPDTLMNAADRALYQAKAMGKNTWRSAMTRAA